MIYLESWNKANMEKFSWNLSRKTDSLCIKWIHTYYIKKEQLMSVNIKSNCSRMLKKTNKFDIRKMYMMLKDDYPVVQWRKILYNNLARPKCCL